MIDTPEATALALRIHAEAYRKKAPNGTLEEQVRSMVRRWRRDGFRGTNEEWAHLARLVEKK
jgi:hypothetical protein